jgi:hypothetical protein
LGQQVGAGFGPVDDRREPAADCRGHDQERKEDADLLGDHEDRRRVPRGLDGGEEDQREGDEEDDATDAMYWAAGIVLIRMSAEG